MVKGIPPKYTQRLGVRLSPTYRTGNYERGERHHRAKLTDAEVELFRQLVESGVSQKDACEKFEISEGHGSKLMSYSQRQKPT